MSVYGDAQLASVRRLTEQRWNRDNVASLTQLLAEIEESGWTTRCREAEQDRKELERSTRLVIARATTAIAHLIDPAHQSYSADARSAELLTFEELHGSIDRIAALFCKYSHLITGSRPDLVNWVIPPWEYAFRFPWIAGSDGLQPAPDYAR